MATGSPSTASTPVDATPDTLTCGTVTGKIEFSPALTNTPATRDVKVSMKLGIRGCAAAPPPAGGPPVSIASAKATGSLSLPNASCTSLGQGGIAGGSMTFKFKTTPRTAKLSSGPSVTFGSFSGGVLATDGSLTIGLPGAIVGLPAVQSTGSFSGLDAGSSSKLSITDGTFMTVKIECGSHSGLKSLAFGDGSLLHG